MGYAFISYSSKNQAAADATKKLFNEKGIQTWMAPNDIPAGSKYAAVIIDALKKCSCLVLLLTHDSHESQWVEKEVERAIAYGKSIITMQLEEIILNDCYEFYLCNQQIVPIQKISESSDGIQKVLSAVIALSGTEMTQKNKPSVAEKANEKPVREVQRQEESIKKNPKPVIDAHILSSLFKPSVVQKPPEDKLKDYVIADTIRGKSLRAYDGTEESVLIPEGVNIIGERAFYAKENLRTVHMPDTVTTIGANAFSGCIHLEQVTFSNALSTIAPQAFRGCKNLKEVRLPRGTIFTDAFDKDCRIFLDED